jgi:hypothetical protein
LDKIQTKFLTVFLLAIQSHLYSFAMRVLSHEVSVWISSNSRNLLQLLYTVQEKGRKPDRKLHPIPFGLRNPYRNLKTENSKDYAQKLRNIKEIVYVHEFGFRFSRGEYQTRLDSSLISVNPMRRTDSGCSRTVNTSTITTFLDYI